MGKKGSERINQALKRRGIELPYKAYPKVVGSKVRRRHGNLCANTRDRVNDLFSDFTDMRPGFHWALFHVDPPENPAPDFEEYPGYDADREIAVIMDNRISLLLPNIRIFTNELIVSDGLDPVMLIEDEEDEEISNYLIEDFTLSPQNIVYYALSAVTEGRDTPSLRYAPLFYVDQPDDSPDENFLVVPRYRGFSRRESMQTHVRRKKDIHPFGYKLSMLDQIDAFKPALAILDEVYLAQPYVYGTQQDI